MKKRRITKTTIIRTYKKTGSIKKTSLQLNLPYSQVRDATLEQRFSKRDKLYRDLLVEYNAYTKEEASLYIQRIKNLHRREKSIYGRPVTQWEGIDT